MIKWFMRSISVCALAVIVTVSMDYGFKNLNIDDYGLVPAKDRFVF